MKYRCRCNCHCTCVNKSFNDEHKAVFVVHVATCALYGRGALSPCCDGCKDLPDNFTFEDLCGVAPPLRCLFKQAQEFKRLAGRKALCANAIWYSTLKPIVEHEVGYAAHHPVEKMNSSKAYDAASKAIYAQLPDCNHGEEMCWSL